MRPLHRLVAPYMGAWIEMRQKIGVALSCVSLPTWERGLKSQVITSRAKPLIVAPYMGAWIEIFLAL